MLKRLLLLVSVVPILLSASITATATNTGFTTLDVNGETVKIYRDDFGIPHIFAETNRGLFEYFYFGSKRVSAVGVAEQRRLRSTFHGPARAV